MIRLTRSRLALFAILLAGLALRLFRLGAESLWYDETVSTYLAGSPLPALLRHTALDIHPPGYYVLLRGWLLLTGYGDGRADPAGYGLEWAAGFFSLFWGVVLIALVYLLAQRLLGARVARVAAALVALSPYNVWYGQEVRMYTLAAVLGVTALLGLLEGVGTRSPRRRSGGGLLIYTLSAAAGLYSLYYFAFLLIPLNLWAAWHAVKTKRVAAWLGANAAVLGLYAPWLPTAWRQATDPPVPPWRTAPALLRGLGETWQALVLGQSAPPWLWPVLVLALGAFGVGLWAMARRDGRHASLLLAAAFGPLALILGGSLVTPLYHVRYLFPSSPAFYIVVAAGLVNLAATAPRRKNILAPVRARPRAMIAFGFALLWIAAVSLTLRAYWVDAAFRSDDHRAAVHDLQAAWRPGDVVVVNAGWAYTALATYWAGDVGGRYRLTGALPEPRDDAALVMVTTGHVDGSPDLGWDDPGADFFALPASVANRQIGDLFDRFPRVWHYRIYDTVNDPQGLLRGLLTAGGTRVVDRVYGGEAFLRLEAYAPDDLAWPAGLPAVRFDALELTWQTVTTSVAAGETVYAAAWWRASEPATSLLATSLRLVDADGVTWAQPPDENPLSPLFTSVEWPPGRVFRQGLALPIPQGVAPGEYEIVLVPYDAGSGQPLTAIALAGDAHLTGAGGFVLGRVTVTRPEPSPTAQRAVATFGPLALIVAHTAAETLSPGDGLTLDLLWQARAAPVEPYVVVVQLLDATGAVIANAESQPLGGRYPTSNWAGGELVRDRQALTLPDGLTPGNYRLIVGLYRAADGVRLTTRTGPFARSDHWLAKTLVIR